MLERSNRSIKSAIQHYCKPGSKDWDEYMELVAAAIRATPSASTGHSPNLMRFGMELNHPADLVYGRGGKTPLDKDAHEHVQAMQSTLKDVWASARRHLKQSAEIQQKSRSQHLVEWQFEVGDIVYKKLPRGAKISPKWIGPCKVTAVISKWLIEIQLGQQRSLLNANNLKPFREVKPEELAP
jgi:hypothetical protein